MSWHHFHAHLGFSGFLIVLAIAVLVAAATAPRRGP